MTSKSAKLRSHRVVTTQCSVDGCKNEHSSKGFCGSHYMRFRRHGDPMGGGTPRGEPMKFVVEKALPFLGSECLPWPFCLAGQGYGTIRYKGKSTLVHRYVCEMANGKPGAAHLEAAHTCGNAICVNPNHLKWATRSENEADKSAHGTVVRGEACHSAKLTAEKVGKIREMKGRATQDEISATFGVSRAVVSSIHRGRSWRWVNQETRHGE